MSSVNQRALFETTIQVDRCKTAARREYIDQLRREFGFCFSTEFTLLEFKATIIQECITIYNQLRLERAYTKSRDRLVESNHRQSRLRAHIFNNLLNVNAPSSFDVTEEFDAELAERACLLLDIHIPRLYKWFGKSVDCILAVTGCTRANEAPTKKRVAYAANLPICKRGINKDCNIEEFIRDRGPRLIQQLQVIPFESNQLDNAVALVQEVVANPDVDLSHSDCRRAGDFLISLEGVGYATHVFSTNAGEWGPLCDANGYQFVRVEYPQ